MMITAIIFLLATTLGSKVSFAFVVSPSNNARALPSDNAVTATKVLGMIGGRGWDNNDYLSNLSGDEQDRTKSHEAYKDFSESRAAFNARQEEIMKTPKGKAFMKQRQEQQHQNLKQEEHQAPRSEDGIIFGNSPQGSGGGTRMAQMMAQAKRMEGRQSQRSNIGGFHQQLLLVPLGDDDDDDDDDDDEGGEI